MDAFGQEICFCRNFSYGDRQLDAAEQSPTPTQPAHSARTCCPASALQTRAFGACAFGACAFGACAFDASAFGACAFDASAFDASAFDASAFDASAFGA